MCTCVCTVVCYVPKKFLNVVTCINNYLFSFYQHSVHGLSVLLLHLCVLL